MGGELLEDRNLTNLTNPVSVSQVKQIFNLDAQQENQYWSKSEKCKRS